MESYKKQYKGITNPIAFVKAPFTQNSLHYRGRSYANYGALMTEISRVVENNTQAIFPYLILQLCVPDNKEYKVIMHNGVPKYFHQRGTSNPSPKLTEPLGRRMFQFATLVHQTLSIRCPHAILDGLVRIDIMKLPDDSLVVNEVEGIDSNYGCSNFEKQLTTVAFLEKYWYQIIVNCLVKNHDIESQQQLIN